jgi:uncharacterized Tic20 family protein
MTSPEPVSNDDKILAAVSYWGSLLLSFIPALVIYLLKKETMSPYLKKQVMQAMAISLLFVALSVLLMIIGTILGAITFGIMAWLMMLVHVGVYLAWAVYALILGVQTFQGADPEIPLLTDWLRQRGF